jgi:hypothetical protein
MTSDVNASGLTNELGLGPQGVESGAQLSVTDKTLVLGHAFLQLSTSDGHANKFALAGLVQHQGAHYAVVKYPPDMTEGVNPVPKIIVKVVNQSTVETISDQEFDEVAERSENAMVDEQLARRVFGDFRVLR